MVNLNGVQYSGVVSSGTQGEAVTTSQVNTVVKLKDPNKSANFVVNAKYIYLENTGASAFHVVFNNDNITNNNKFSSVDNNSASTGSIEVEPSSSVEVSGLVFTSFTIAETGASYRFKAYY